MEPLITIRVYRVVNGFIVSVGESREKQAAFYCKDMNEVRVFIAKEVLMLQGNLE